MDDQQLFDDPVASSISALEADIFSGDHLPSPPWPDLDLDDESILQDVSPRAVNANASSSGGSGSRRKLSHNAYERDRRKEINELYSSLRSLLPNDDYTKKMSIPTTVCRVLKYIPELQKEVDYLERKKEALTKANCKKTGIAMNTAGSITPVVSATFLNNMEIIVQVSLLCSLAATTLPLSECIKVLENEGLHLISSSTHSTFRNMTFYTLHLQRNQRTDKEHSTFCDELERVVREKVEG